VSREEPTVQPSVLVPVGYCRTGRQDLQQPTVRIRGTVQYSSLEYWNLSYVGFSRDSAVEQTLPTGHNQAAYSKIAVLYAVVRITQSFYHFCCFR
jgi:hypothetical protein